MALYKLIENNFQKKKRENVEEGEGEFNNREFFKK